MTKQATSHMQHAHRNQDGGGDDGGEAEKGEKGSK